MFNEKSEVKLLFLRLSLLLCVFFSVGCAQDRGDEAQISERPKPKNFEDYWFNGAEISRFDLQQTRYGETHNGSAEFIFVTEPFLTEAQVKHEFGPGPSTPVLKLNALRTFNTGLYSYRTMTSVFSPIDTSAFSHALKTTSSVQDWCGQAFMQFNYREQHWAVQLNSYFQSEGDASLDLEGVWLEDEIWTRIRLAPDELPLGEVSMIPGALFLRFRHVMPAVFEVNASLRSSGKNKVYTLEYPQLGRTLSIEFENAFPFRIEGWSESSTADALKTTARRTHELEHRYYWEENKNSHRKVRDELGLERDTQ